MRNTGLLPIIRENRSASGNVVRGKSRTNFSSATSTDQVLLVAVDGLMDEGDLRFGRVTATSVGQPSVVVRSQEVKLEETVTVAATFLVNLVVVGTGGFDADVAHNTGGGSGVVTPGSADLAPDGITAGKTILGGVVEAGDSLDASFEGGGGKSSDHDDDDRSENKSELEHLYVLFLFLFCKKVVDEITQ